MIKSFTTITEENLVSEWSKFLEIQAKLCVEKDVDFMSWMGLDAKAGPILDLGCGVGAYTLELKKRFPEAKIVATDVNKGLLDIFRQGLGKKSISGIDLFHWDSNAASVPPSVKECKSCIMRMVLQHVIEPKDVLDSLKTVLPKGAKLYVIEEDDGFFQIHPEFPEFWKVVETWKKYGNKYVNTRTMGRQMPYLLSKAGFKVCASEIVSHTNLEWGIDKTREFFIGTLHLIHASDPEIISKDEIEQIEKGFIQHKKKYGNDCLIIYPQVITVSEVT